MDDAIERVFKLTTLLIFIILDSIVIIIPQRAVLYSLSIFLNLFSIPTSERCSQSAYDNRDIPESATIKFVATNFFFFFWGYKLTPEEHAVALDEISD